MVLNKAVLVDNIVVNIIVLDTENPPTYPTEVQFVDIGEGCDIGTRYENGVFIMPEQPQQY